jgi:hypothetical protein
MFWTVANLPFATRPASRKAFRPSRRRRSALVDGPGSRRWLRAAGSTSLSLTCPPSPGGLANRLCGLGWITSILSLAGQDAPWMR